MEPYKVVRDSSVLKQKVYGNIKTQANTTQYMTSFGYNYFDKKNLSNKER